MILRLFNSLISNGDFQNPTQTSLETDLINVSFAQENFQSKTTQKKEILAPTIWLSLLRSDDHFERSDRCLN